MFDFDDIAGPAFVDLVFGRERYLQLEMFAGFYCMANQNFRDLVGHFWRTAAGDFIVNPERDDDVTVVAVAESGMQLVIDIDQPSFAHDGLDAGQRVIQRGVFSLTGDPTSVEPWQPLLPCGHTFELVAQVQEARRCGNKAVAGPRTVGRRLVARLDLLGGADRIPQNLTAAAWSGAK